MNLIKKLSRLALFSVFGLIVFVIGVSGDETVFRHLYPSSVKSIEPDIALELINNPDVLILDVREQDEYEVSHIANAHRFDKRILNIIPKDRPILLYCTVGYRSAIEADQLIEMGFQNVNNLTGGLIYWKNSDQKVVNKMNEETDSVHVFNNFYSLWLKKGMAVL